MGETKNLGFGIHGFIPLQFELGNVYADIVSKLDTKDKHLAPFLMQHIIRTGNVDVLKSRNLTKLAEKYYEDSIENTRDKITQILSEYKIFNRKLLTIDVMNMFQVNEEDVNKILKDMENRGRIKLTADKVEQL